MDENKVARIKELVNILNHASKVYYQDGSEEMSNFEYDKLYDELVALEKETGFVMSESPTVNVGYEVPRELEDGRQGEKREKNGIVAADQSVPAEPPHPRYLEHRLDDYGAREDERDELPEACRHGDERVPEGVLPDGAPARKPFRDGGADVV